MRQRVAIVTDSTASIPRSLAASAGIEIVPLQLQVDGVEDDESRIPSADLAAAMRANLPVATAPPSAGAFFWTYQGLAARGATSVLSIHLSGKLSQTVDAARAAAEKVTVPVRVLDSATAGTSLGFSALAAANTAADGATVAEATAAAVTRGDSCTQLFYVDSLEYLRRSGRISAAQRFVGEALSLKPVLTITKGVITPLHRVRGAQRAHSRMVEIVADRAGNAAVDVAIEHFAADVEAQRLAERLRARLAGLRELMFTEVSAIIGAHVGPGSLGVTLAPR